MYYSVICWREKITNKADVIEKGSIKLNGILDESAWNSVEPATRFKQRDQNKGDLCTEKTEVYVICDEDNLYIGAKLLPWYLGRWLQYNFKSKFSKN